MAKFEKVLTGDFDSILDGIDRAVMSGNISASREDASDMYIDDVRCGVRVYERYSMIGGNRVSLNVTLLGKGSQLYLSAIASGGSQGVLFKINTFGEQAFLDCIIRLF